MNLLNQAKLNSIVESAVSKKHIKGAVFHVESNDGNIALTSAAGNLDTGSLFYIASINKLIIAAITLRLSRDNKLSLSDKISQYLPGELLQGLHVYKGHDYSGDIAIAHLISHTSGLPCYLIDKRPGAPKVMDELLKGVDQAWPFEQVIKQVKEMKAGFRPGQKGKANYANTNTRLLGRILEVVTQMSIDTLLDDLFLELGMCSTFVLKPSADRAYAPFYVKENPVNASVYFASSKFDIVSNVQDLKIFLKAFFNGYFYPKEKLQELEQWNNVFFPFKYGVGIQKFYIPRILSPFKPVPAMIGHCGSTGTVAFYIPEKDVFVSGSVNQAKSPNTAFQTMIRIMNLL